MRSSKRVFKKQKFVKFQNFDLWSIKNNDKKNYQHVLSSFEVTSGSYFYEIEVLKYGEIQVGWVNHLAVFNDKSGIAINGNSIIGKNNLVSPKDCIGCLINVENKESILYFNGKQINVAKNNIFFDKTPIFAAVSLSPNQHVNVNFGQKPFKNPPHKDNIFKTFYLSNKKKKSKLKLQKCSGYKWFCSTNFNLIYNFQNFQTTKIKIFSNIYSTNLFNYSYFLNIIKINFKNNNIEYLLNFITKKTYYEDNFFNFFQTFFLKNDKYNHKKIEYLHFFIWNYIDVIKKNKKFLNLRKNCFLCIILAYFDKLGKCCSKLEIKTNIFLKNLFIYSNDNLTQLYSLIALEKNIENCFFENFKIIKNISKKLKHFIFFWKNKFIENESIIIKSFNTNKELAIQLQLYLCANFFFNHYIQSKTLKPKNPNCLKKNKVFLIKPSENIKLSPLKNMIRYDGNGLKTYFSDEVYVNSNFCFKVIILTSGEMIIGISSNITTDLVGQNKHSIGIDGYNQCVWANKVRYNFKTVMPKWKIGDEIQICYNKKIYFKINEKLIELENDFYLNMDNYNYTFISIYPTVSLGKFQQCYFDWNCKLNTNQQKKQKQDVYVSTRKNIVVKQIEKSYNQMLSTIFKLNKNPNLNIQQQGKIINQ